MSNRPAMALALVLSLGGLAPGVHAQSNPPGTIGEALDLGNLLNQPSDVSAIPIDLLPPGARALGLGGAFGAVADDATAAEANPAGQVQLLAPELSIHVRHSDSDLDFYDPEARNPEAFGGGAGQPINNYSDSATNVAFASFVYPWERFVFSAYYTNNADIDALATPSTVFSSALQDEYVSRNSIAGEFDGYGLSLAWRANEFVSIGLSVKRTELSLDSLDQTTIRNFRDFEFLFNQFRPDISLADFAAAVDDEFVIGSNVSGDDSATTITAGLILNPAQKFSVGLVYKEGSEYDIPTTFLFQQSLGCVGSGPATDICNIGFDGIDLTPFNQTSTVTLDRRFDLPDILTLGFAWRPTDTWLLSLDINNIDYSDLPQPRPSTLGLEVPVDGSLVVDGQVFFDDIEPIGDAVTYHFGAEKVFFLDGDLFNLFTLRGGAFTDDDRDGTRLLDTDDTHYTLGLGLVMLDGKLQMDLAGDFSDRTDNFVLSAIYRF